MADGAECPRCLVRGRVVKRKDAYVNFTVRADGTMDLDDCSNVDLFDDEIFQCLECMEQLDIEDIEEHNSIVIEH
jgi:hypothetical protein